MFSLCTATFIKDRAHLVRSWLLVAGLVMAAVVHAAPTRSTPGTAVAEHDQLAQITSRRFIRVAVPKEFPPFGFMRDGLPEGYDISVARILALDLGVRVELVPVASSDRISHLQEGKVDIVIASLGKTAEREKLIDFSVAYAPLYLGVFGRKDSGATADLSGRRVAFVRGSLEGAELRRTAPAATPVEFENSKDIIQAYVKRQVDYIAVGSAVIESIDDVQARDQTRLLITLKDSPCYIGLRKGEPRLQERINKVLRDASRSGAMTVNAMIWFKATLPPDFFKR